MAADLAELSSVCSTLDQLARRCASMGEAAQATKDEEVASELFAAERAIEGARRRLNRLVERSR